MRIRKKPVEVEAMQWTGDNVEELWAFTDRKFYSTDPEDRTDDPDLTGSVFDKLHATWVGVKDGQWIIRGVLGEFYPCDDEVLWKTYEVVE